MTIAGALERKVHMRVSRRNLYPNLYVLLVGPPGVGKTDALRDVKEFWGGLTELHVAPSSVSRASLIDALVGAERTVVRLDDLIPFSKFNSLAVAATEFGTFLSAYDTEFMSTLNDLYDNVVYKEQKRGNHISIDMPNPQLNLIAGTTPAWLGNALPETAWAEGFTSRVLIIYSGERVLVDPWADEGKDEALEADLAFDLAQIHNLYGQFNMTEEFADIYRNWYLSGCQPQPEHPRLEHYIPRRHTHFLKLCMIMSAARSSEMLLTIEDYQEAQDLLLEAETAMPDVFKAMRQTSDANVMDEAFAMIWTEYSKTGKNIPHYRIIHFLSQRVPGHGVDKVLQVMVNSNMIQMANVAGLQGKPEYKPMPRATHGV